MRIKGDCFAKNNYNLRKRKVFWILKKLVALILTLVAIFGVCAVSASAFLGPGAQVIASDIKMVKTGLKGHKMTFTDGDFKSALCVTDFNSITVTSIPTSLEGTLLLGGRRVSEGREIQRKNLGGLVFVPASKSVSECSFKFKVDGGSEIECSLKFIDKVNYAPKTDSIPTVKTQQNISVYSSVSASDPEGDRLEYIVVSYPAEGRVCFLDGGKFCYTPDSDYTGEDKFTYVVRDDYGNYSEPMAVKIEVVNRMCSTVYIDMEDRSEYNAAVAMTAMGIMGGKILGDDVYFNPDEELSRAEFVALAMKSVGVRPDSSISSSYFDDDADIPLSLKPYVATAQRIGLISGDFADGKLTFEPNKSITKYEAAKILASLIGVDGDGEESVFATDEEIPIWARPAVSAMCMLGVFDVEDAENSSGAVTRASAAEYFYRIENSK